MAKTANNSDKSEKSNKGESAAKPVETGARVDVGALRAALAKASGLPQVSRPALAKLIGAHPNSIALWESGSKIGEKYLTKLAELEAKVSKGERVELPERKKGGRPKKAKPATAPAATGTAKRGRPAKAPASIPSVDVKALRASLGASRDAFARLLGVSAGSILNWESGKSQLTEKNAAKLVQLAARAKAGEIAPLASKKGRPPKATPRSAVVATTGPSMAITGACPVLYANAVAIESGRHDARLRFALELTRGEMRAIVDVMIPREILAQMQGG